MSYATSINCVLHLHLLFCLNFGAKIRVQAEIRGKCNTVYDRCLEVYNEYSESFRPECTPDNETSVKA